MGNTSMAFSALIEPSPKKLIGVKLLKFEIEMQTRTCNSISGTFRQGQVQGMCSTRL